MELSKYANKVYKIIGAAMTVHSELGYPTSVSSLIVICIQ